MVRLVATCAALAVCMCIPLAAGAAGQSPVVCSQVTQEFTGTASTLIVPQGGYCAVSSATITGDLILQGDAGADLANVTVGRDLTLADGAGAGISDTSVGRDLTAGAFGGFDLSGVKVGRDVRLGSTSEAHMERTTIGHDFAAFEPLTVQTGMNGPNSSGGPVSVGHDATITGSPAGESFVFDGVCDLVVGHDLKVTNRAVTLGIGLASVSCAQRGLPGDTIKHDLVFTGNIGLNGFFGPAGLRVGDNRVGHDLVVSGNSTAPGGTIEVTNNVVGHDLVCSANAPEVTVTTPNTAGHANTCG